MMPGVGFKGGRVHLSGFVYGVAVGELLEQYRDEGGPECKHTRRLKLFSVEPCCYALCTVAEYADRDDDQGNTDYGERKRLVFAVSVIV